MVQETMSGGLVAIRATTEADLDYVIGVERHPENSLYVDQWPESFHLDAMTGSGFAHWIVERIATGTPVGYMVLQDVDNPHDSMWFRRIAISEKGQGYGKEAVWLAARYCFDAQQFHRLWLNVRVGNKRAYSLYECLGFKYEGTARECLKHHDEYESLWVMSLLRQEYEATECDRAG